jgi:drug/metabolite transporter (DMT)-like permease
VSITMTSVANATLFNNCAPVVVAVLGWALFGERVGRALVVALAVAVSGMALLIGDGFAVSVGQVRGDALAVLTAAFYAVYLLIVKRLRATQSTSRIMAGTSAAAAAALLVAALVEGGPLIPQTAWGWGVLLTLGVACHVLGQGLITHALAHLPVTFSSVGLLVQPIAAAALAWVLFGEALGPVQWLGGGLVLLGITLARGATRR